VTIEDPVDAVTQAVDVPSREAPDDVVPVVARLARRGDLIVTLGAGSIGGLGGKLVEALETREAAGRARLGSGERGPTS
jgi:UDP-N-acetylmuramate-alanine ligase